MFDFEANLTELQRYRNAQARKQIMQKLEDERRSKVAECVSRFTNALKKEEKQCSLCGASGHCAKDCKWNVPTKPMLYRTDTGFGEL